MKKLLLIIFMLNTAVVSLVSAVHAKEKIVACGHPDYPPFMWQKGKDTVGAGVEIINIIFQKFGVEVVSKSIGNWKRCLATVKDGKADIIVAAYITDERKKYLTYTKQHIGEEATSIFVWQGREFKFEKWEDLIGRTAGTVFGESHGQEFDEFLEQNIKIERVSRRAQNYKKLELGRIDFEPTGFYSGTIQARMSKYNGKIVPLKTPAQINFLHIAISNKSKYLSYLPQIEIELKKLHADGTIDTLIKKYIDCYIEEAK